MEIGLGTVQQRLLWQLALQICLSKLSSFDQTLLWGKRMLPFVRRRSHGLVSIDNIVVQALTTA